MCSICEIEIQNDEARMGSDFRTVDDLVEHWRQRAIAAEGKLQAEVNRGHELQEQVAALQSTEHCANAHDHTGRCGWCQRDEAIRVLCAVERCLGGNYREMVETFLAPYAGVVEIGVKNCTATKGLPLDAPGWKTAYTCELPSGHAGEHREGPVLWKD